MARILLGWELGGGAGHHVKLRGIAAELVARGHEPVLAMQQTDALDPALPCWQAPLWPGQVLARARPVTRLPVTMGDILATLGLENGDAVRALVAAWDHVIRAIAPDLVLAEFAPGLLLAARGRVPTLALGTGFTLPPADLAAFPSLTGASAPATPEAPMLDTLNRALAANGRAPLAALPALFAADEELQSVFVELDPYRGHRRVAPGVPSCTAIDPDAVGGLRDEIFVYLNGTRGPQAPFWTGLATCGRPVRLYCTGLVAEDVAKLEQAGIAVERKPVPFAKIAQRSRFVVSHGGLGFTASSLAAGLPHVIAPCDLEKELLARDVMAIGLGRRADLDVRDAEAFAATLRGLYDDEALGRRARAAAAGFRARLGATVAVEVAGRAEAMLGR